MGRVKRGEKNNNTPQASTLKVEELLDRDVGINPLKRGARGAAHTGNPRSAGAGAGAGLACFEKCRRWKDNKRKVW